MNERREEENRYIRCIFPRVVNAKREKKSERVNVRERERERERGQVKDDGNKRCGEIEGVRVRVGECVRARKEGTKPRSTSFLFPPSQQAVSRSFFDARRGKVCITVRCANRRRGRKGLRWPVSLFLRGVGSVKSKFIGVSV